MCIRDRSLTYARIWTLEPSALASWTLPQYCQSSSHVDIHCEFSRPQGSELGYWWEYELVPLHAASTGCGVATARIAPRRPTAINMARTLFLDSCLRTDVMSFSLPCVGSSSRRLLPVLRVRALSCSRRWVRRRF